MEPLLGRIQRAYREDVMAFVKFMGLAWPDQAGSRGF